MAVFFFLFSLLLLAPLITATGLLPISSAEAPGNSISQQPFPAGTPLPPAPAIQENQLSNIIDALTGADDDWADWAGLLSTANSSAIPITATFFIPSNDALSHFSSMTAAGLNFDPFLIPYHIVPRRLAFADLQKLTANSRLTTLLPGKFIVVTNNSTADFSVDDSRVTDKDVFLSDVLAVHGIEKVLDYSRYGGNTLLTPPPIRTPPPKAEQLPVPPANDIPVAPGEDGIIILRSCTSCQACLLFQLLGIIFCVLELDRLHGFCANHVGLY